MKKFNTSPISGMQELLPGLQTEFDRLKAGIEEAFYRHGYQHIETPTIDRTEILLAKAGGDTEKQIYKVVKTAETADDADQALRFDHTVPLARYTVEHANDLAFPFKVTQVGRNFRGERAQKGRFREFYQCDVDVIGWGKLPFSYDADAISTLIDALKILPLPGSGFLVRISNRKLLSGLLEAMNLEQHASEIFNIIDHAEKVPPEATKEALAEIGMGSENVVKITTFMTIKGGRKEVIDKLLALESDNETFVAGVNELAIVLESLEQQGLSEVITADMMIVRGLDYYTGTVFETIVPDHREIGSICGGGRYENLAENYTAQAMPGVGGSIGLTRLFYLLQNYGMVKASELKPVDICVIPFGETEIGAANQLAEKLRASGKSVDIEYAGKGLGDKMRYASRVANAAVVVGENEVKTGKFMLKDLATGESSELKI